jgi:hypothetical protein
MKWNAIRTNAFRSGSSRRRQQLAATGKSIWFELSSEFTRWKQRLDAKNAASTGMKPVESLDPYLQRSSCQLSPHWHKASGSETQEKIHYRVSEWARLCS